MKNRKVARHALVFSIVALMTGCGPQPPSLGLTPLAPASRAMTSGSLLYVLDKLRGRKISVYTFPAGTPQKRVLLPTEGWAYICSDSKGYVYAPAYGVVFKYAHSGQKPVAYLQNKGALGQECASDPKTGNLAVINSGGTKACTFVIYKDAKGKPTCLNEPGIGAVYPSYDDRGDLFFNGGTKKDPSFLAEIPAGSTKAIKITLNQDISNYDDLQWDGQDVAIQTKLPGTLDQPIVIDRVHVSGTKGMIVKTIRFKGWSNQTEYFWISGNLIVAPLSFSGPFGIWNYPQGGKKVGSIAIPNFCSWTVSVAPSS
jgi:hypothetical protein